MSQSAIIPTIPKAWPFQEAAKLLARVEKHGVPTKGYILFETGYGPSGLPHIGTFGEVARTAMVQRAFTEMSGLPTRLYCVSDDMDGLRKVPDNIPNPELVRAHLGKPLTNVPDPYGTHESYGAHMNARLQAFLDGFGFDYTFISSSEHYKNGVYDATLLLLLRHYDAVMQLMLPTLGEERQQTYSPFLPIHPETGEVLYVPVLERDLEKGRILCDLGEGKTLDVAVTGGACKLQWKPDMGMRWAALDVDYEMYGKDHRASVDLYAGICKILGGNPPEGFAFELFLDAEGKKISKSKGNGISIEDWLGYGSAESLSLFMYQSPTKAKRLHFDVIPRHVEDYFAHLNKFHTLEDAAARYENPAWHIHAGDVPADGMAGISFTLLLNLASACNPEDASVLWGFISRYAPGISPQSNPLLDSYVTYAVKYYYDFIRPYKKFRAPDATECVALQALAEALRAVPVEQQRDAEYLQTEIYRIGREYAFEPMRAWFSCMYEVLLGSEQGPRMGSFFALYGVEESLKLIEEGLGRDV